MAINRFEAALLYERDVLKQEAAAGTTAVFDTDTLEIGICTVTEAKEIQVIGSTGPVEEGESLKRQATSPAQAIFGNWQAAKRQVNEKVELFYRSSGAEDGIISIENTGAKSTKCSELVDSFAGINEALQPVFEKAAQLLEDNHLNEDEVRFLLAGEFSDYVLFLYAIKEFFSFSAFMNDRRFSDYTLSASLTTVVEQMTPAPEEKVEQAVVEFLLCERNEEGKIVEISLSASKSDQVMEYSAPVYVGRGDKLHFRVNGADRMVTVPFEVTAEGDLVEVAINATGTVRLRKAYMPDKVYELDLNR